MIPPQLIVKYSYLFTRIKGQEFFYSMNGVAFVVVERQNKKPRQIDEAFCSSYLPSNYNCLQDLAPFQAIA